MSVSSLGGAKYFATFVNDKSRYIKIKPLKRKSEILETFKEYKTRIEKITGRCIKKLRTDNAKEYLSKEFSEFFKEGRDHETVGNTSQVEIFLLFSTSMFNLTPTFDQNVRSNTYFDTLSSRITLF